MGLFRNKENACQILRLSGTNLYEFCQITFKLCNFTNFKVLLPLVLIDFS